MRKIQITLIRHTNGQFSVGRDLGTGHGSKVLPGREEADAYARQLQAQLGGPDKATIVVHDLRKAMAADKPAAQRPALAATLPAGSVSYEDEANSKGERLIWLEARWVDKLAAMRGPGESYSDVILRLASDEQAR